MIDIRPATADEMVLAFLRGEVDSPTNRGQLVIDAIARIGANRVELLDHADLNDPQQNKARRRVLGETRGYGLGQWLFVGFPDDTTWRLVTVTPAEVKRFRYANCEPWASLSGTSRLVADGVKNLDLVQNAVVRPDVFGIAARLPRHQFPQLIATQPAGATDIVLMEGHTRATAYALTNMPNEIEVFIGTSPGMAGWSFF